MKKILLKEGHLQIYKRENSKIWQIKIKLPSLKAIRVSSGTSELVEAKKIAKKKYSLLNFENSKNIYINKKHPIKKIHYNNIIDVNYNTNNDYGQCSV